MTDMLLAPGPLRFELPVEPRDFWQEEIAFISGVTSNATVAANSYGAWSAAGAAFPVTYDPTLSDANKWGDTTLSRSGTPGEASYWFDPVWNATAKDEIKSALALWSAVVNISFTEVMDPASADFTIKRLSNTFASTPNLGSSTIGGDVVSEPGTGAFITIGTDTAPLDGSFETRGADAYFALVHELGHIIGLGHGGPYNSSEDLHGQTKFIAEKLQLGRYDMQLWAIMSYITPDITDAKYFAEYPVKGTDWGVTEDPSDGELYPNRPTTPMMLDILAAQRIYGRPTDGPLVDGNDVFGFNVHLGNGEVAKLIERYFDFTVNTHPVITIWDGGINNTLDLSGWSTPSTINLNPGTFSSANGQTNNIGIALDTVIETAKGGDGSDTIIGNDYANFLFGNVGDDDLNGGAGSDTLNGGPGNDALTGGLGADRFVLAKISDGVDTFLDFSRIQHDQIALDHGGFDLGETGTLAAVGVSLVNGATAQTFEPTILYNAGDVSWDSDGTGADAPTLLAHVLTVEAPTVVANPIVPGPVMVSSAAHVFPELSADDFVIV
jgi:Ca2+-binding RTX toxin-like protein